MDKSGGKQEYKYEVVLIKQIHWTGQLETDYLQVINEYAKKGWRFISFVPPLMKSRGSEKGVELLFEVKLSQD